MSLSLNYRPVFLDQIGMVLTFRFTGQKAASTDIFKLHVEPI